MHLKKIMVSLMLFGSLSLISKTTWALTYYVQPGDSLFTIAQRYKTTTSNLQQTNRLVSNALYPGQALVVGLSGQSTSSSNTYTVKNGDSLYLIARNFGITVESLRQANSTSENLWVGQKLKIPAVITNNTSNSSQNSSNYTVKNGDTWYLISKKYGVSLDTLLSTNQVNMNTPLYQGIVIKIPKTASVPTTSKTSYNLSQSDLNLFARLVSAEAGSESFEGQVAVAATILNRLRSPQYPKTISGIIYQIDSGRYQYSPVLDGRINLPASQAAYQAVQAALTGWDPTKGATGFYNPAKTTNQWVRSHPITTIIGGHVFFIY